MVLEFEWHAAKALENLKKHRVSSKRPRPFLMIHFCLLFLTRNIPDGNIAPSVSACHPMLMFCW